MLRKFNQGAVKRLLEGDLPHNLEEGDLDSQDAATVLICVHKRRMMGIEASINLALAITDCRLNRPDQFKKNADLAIQELQELNARHTPLDTVIH